jgi:RNA polymerase sigma-70 factor (ECF subfamily)
MLRGDDDVSYLMRVLRNTFLTSRRTAGRRPVVGATLEDVKPVEREPMVQPEQALEVHEVYDAIATLPEDFRLTLVAVDMLGLSYKEAGRILKVREATVTTRLFRARRQVAGALGPTSADAAPPAAGAGGSATAGGKDEREGSGGRGSLAEQVHP